jgi:hypothetical protein
MSNPKTDLENLFPDPERILQAQRSAAPHFMRCPGGHLLPNRTTSGRCSPMDCVERPKLQPGSKAQKDAAVNMRPYEAEMRLQPVGTEQASTEPTLTAEAEMALAQAKEALVLMRLVGIKQAREALHPMPKVPAAPTGVSQKEYVKQRLEDIAPYLLERKIFTALFNPGDAGDEAAAELLERAGFPRKTDPAPDYRGPVIFVGGTFVSPYSQQKELRNEQPRVVEGSLAVDGSVQQSARGSGHPALGNGSDDEEGVRVDSAAAGEGYPVALSPQAGGLEEAGE